MMVRKRLVVSIITSLILIFMLAACNGNTKSSSTKDPSNVDEKKTEQKPVDLVFGSYVPAAHVANTEAFQPWSEYVNEESDGGVKIDFQPGGVLGGSSSVIPDVAGGVYDIGFSAAQFYPETPLFKVTILDLPFAFSNTDDHLKKVKVAQRYVDEYVKDDFEKLGVKLMGVYTTDPIVMFSSKPISSVADLKGKSTQLQAASWEPILNEWGALPVSVPLEEVYTSLDRGTLDVGVFATTGIYPNKLYEPAPYITDFPISSVTAAVVMNLEKYKSMLPEWQKRFEEEFNPKVEELINSMYASNVEKSRETLAAEIKGKGEFVKLSPEQKAGFMEPGKRVWETWVEEANKKGHNGKELLDGLLRIMEEEGIEPPFTF
jgi:TRAP-type transport system periplasmic protein